MWKQKVVEIITLSSNPFDSVNLTTVHVPQLCLFLVGALLMGPNDLHIHRDLWSYYRCLRKQSSHKGEHMLNNEREIVIFIECINGRIQWNL